MLAFSDLAVARPVHTYFFRLGQTIFFCTYAIWYFSKNQSQCRLSSMQCHFVSGFSVVRSARASSAHYLSCNIFFEFMWFYVQYSRFPCNGWNVFGFASYFTSNYFLNQNCFQKSPSVSTRASEWWDLCVVSARRGHKEDIYFNIFEIDWQQDSLFYSRELYKQLMEQRILKALWPLLFFFEIFQ